MTAEGTERRPAVGRPRKMTREKIVAAALQVMEDADFAALSMRALARHLGVNHATLYNYVDDLAEVEQQALDELMSRIPMPDAASPVPLRQQLIEHLLAVRRTQLLYPKFCHAPPGSRAWRLHMGCVAQVIRACCGEDDQVEDVAIAYNALIGLVATSAERSRASGSNTSITPDLQALAALPRDEFEPLFRPLVANGGYAPKLTSLVYRLDHLIGLLMPQLPPLDEEAIAAMQTTFSKGAGSSGW